MLYINGFFLTTSNRSGVYRFALNMLYQMDEILYHSGKCLEFGVVIPFYSDNLPKLKFIKYCICKGFSNQHLWEQINLAWYTRNNWLINLANFAPIFKKQQISIIHDALIFVYPKAYSWKFKLLTQFIHRKIVKNSYYIATVSDFSANEIQHYMGRSTNNILVLGNSAEHLEIVVGDSNILDKYNLMPKKYIMAVFSQQNSLYKNAVAYCKVANQIDYQFIAVGNVCFEPDFPQPKNLLNLGFISDSELKALYCNATFLLIPSFYEGFGIPALEAMTCGCPVLASDIQVFKEVCADAAWYFNVSNPLDLFEKINKMLQSPSELSKMSKRGLIQARKFIWQDYANRLLALLESNP